MSWISPNDTICETIRGIYNLSDNPEIRLKCRIATAMAKAMTAKLIEYKENWADGFFDKNDDFIKGFLDLRSASIGKGRPKVQIVTEKLFQWIKGYRDVFRENGWGTDVVKSPKLDPDVSVWLFMWLNDESVAFAEMFPDLPKIQFIRRYDYYSKLVESMDWPKVNHVIMLNDFLARGFKSRTGIEPIVIRNGVSVESWTFRERAHGTKIAVVGLLNMKKTIPMAVQILRSLPKEYTLHLAGEAQQAEVLDYLVYHSEGILEKRITWYKKVEHKFMDSWLDDKDYLLSVSLSEGCPNNVIEAMAKGIKTVVHNWPGASDQFSGNTFNTIDEAVKMILPDSPYESRGYRSKIENEFGKNQFQEVFNLTKGLMPYV